MEKRKFEDCYELDREDFGNELDGMESITLSVENETKDIPGEEPRYDLDFPIIHDESNLFSFLQNDEKGVLSNFIVNVSVSKVISDRVKNIRFENCIFLKQASFYFIDELSIKNCIFLSNINIHSVKKIDIFESFGNGLNMSMECKSINIQSPGNKKSLFQSISLSSITSSIIEVYGLHIGALRLYDVKTEILRLNRIKIWTSMVVQKCFCYKEYNLIQNSLLNKSELIINNSTLNSSGEISFSDLNGSIEIYRSNINNCLLDYEKLSQEKYRTIKKNIESSRDAKKIKWTFFNISKIYKENGKIKESLETYSLSKKYERIENIKKRKGIKKAYSILENLPSYLINLTTGHFASPVKVLFTSVIIIFLFSIVYFTNRHLLICENDIKSIYDSIYFSLITFVTIGYGDISPSGWLMILAGIEGFLGVALISLLSVTLTRRYIQ